MPPPAAEDEKPGREWDRDSDGGRERGWERERERRRGVETVELGWDWDLEVARDVEEALDSGRVVPFLVPPFLLLLLLLLPRTVGVERDRGMMDGGLFQPLALANRAASFALRAWCGGDAMLFCGVGEQGKGVRACRTSNSNAKQENTTAQAHHVACITPVQPLTHMAWHGVQHQLTQPTPTTTPRTTHTTHPPVAPGCTKASAARRPQT